MIVLLAIILIAVLVAILAIQPRGKPRARRRSFKEILPFRFVVADLETTGLDPNIDEIIEIGAIRVNRDLDLNETFRVLVNPGCKLPKDIVRLTGVTDEMLAQDGCNIEQAISDFLDFIGDDLLVFYNARFDIAFLNEAAQRIGRHIPNKVCCALEAARAAWPGLQSYRLADISADYGLGAQGADRALVDCRHTAVVYAAAVEQTGRLSQLRRRARS
ncbi:MAG: 3'-5' exonuclease [Hyphomicrobiaceae bacterium]|nr:3'-5' exonuclease [Hyphomicrobiaceae bacterium]